MNLQAIDIIFIIVIAVMGLNGFKKEYIIFYIEIKDYKLQHNG